MLMETHHGETKNTKGNVTTSNRLSCINSLEGNLTHYIQCVTPTYKISLRSRLGGHEVSRSDMFHPQVGLSPFGDTRQ